ncbi:hypothetical protein C8J57DRAFT_1293615 [Mycena rebaudengoi]|nr:hypothetical protein C8J57DRAFT_1293615 [Mycena rebaudengoi]
MFRLSTRILASSRPSVIHHVHIPRRTIFGIGEKPKPQPPAAPAAENPVINDADLQKTTQLVQSLFQDKPKAVEAVVKFTTVMQELGVDVAGGRMPGPMQLMKLATNSKFREAYAEVDSELKKAGINVQDKEFLAEMTKLTKQLAKGS